MKANLLTRKNLKIAGALAVLIAFGLVTGPAMANLEWLTTNVSGPADSEELGNGRSILSRMSYSGTTITFDSEATNLLDYNPGGSDHHTDPDSYSDIFIYDHSAVEDPSTQLPVIQEITMGANGSSLYPAINRISDASSERDQDGRFIAFQSKSTTFNLLTPAGSDPSSSKWDVFLYDKGAGSVSERITAISRGYRGAEPNGNSGNVGYPATFLTSSHLGHIAANTLHPGVDVYASQYKPYVAFESDATNLIQGGTTSGRRNIFLRDVYKVSNDTPGEANSCSAPVLDVYISEVRTDQPGSAEDTDEYFELGGNPGTSLNGLTFVAISGGTDSAGVIQTAVSLDGKTITDNGTLTAAENTFSLGSRNMTADLNFNDDQDLTLLLVRDFSAAVGDDLDLEDDGTLDSMPWGDVIDSVAVVKSGGGIAYPVNTEIGPDSDGYIPGQIYRCESGWQIGRFDPMAGETTLISKNAAGQEANGDSTNPVVSSDGRFIAFVSYATNLVPGVSTGGKAQVYLLDRNSDGSGTPRYYMVSRYVDNLSATPGAAGNDDSWYPSIAYANGVVYVAFQTFANNFYDTPITGDSIPDTNKAVDVYLYVLSPSTLETFPSREIMYLVSRASGFTGAQGNFHSLTPYISADGQVVAFTSYATNLVDGDNNYYCEFRIDGQTRTNCPDVFVRNFLKRQTWRISVTNEGEQAWYNSSFPSLSGKGRYGAFTTYADLRSGIDHYGEQATYLQIFVRDQGEDVGNPNIQPNSGEFYTSKDEPISVTFTIDFLGPLMIGDGSADPSPITILGTNPEYFSVADDTCSGGIFHDGDSCSFTVWFTPTDQYGKNAKVQIPVNDSRQNLYLSLRGYTVVRYIPLMMP